MKSISIKTKAQIITQYNITADDYVAYNLAQATRQRTNLIHYHHGTALRNMSNGKKQVTTFKMLGNQYTTNHNRTKQYCLDAKWKPIPLGVFTRAMMVLRGNVHKLNPAKKAILAGI